MNERRKWMKKERTWSFCLVSLLFCIWSSAAFAADKITVRALGSFTNQIQSTMIEVPFYKKLKAEAAAKNLDIQFRTMDELGQKGYTALRQLKEGTFDIIQMQTGYISGDDPHWSELTLIGIKPDLDTCREAANAYRPILDKGLAEKFNGRLLALWPYGAQMFYFKGPIKSLADFKGKKIRILTRPSADFVAYLGATGVTMPFPEVYTSLQKGVIDGAISGALAGNTASWWEASDYLYAMPLEFGMQAHAVNLNFWNKLNADQREFLTQKFKEMDDEFWRVAKEVDEDGINCNTGIGSCKYGKKGKMTLIRPTKADLDMMRKVGQEVILKNWVTECNKLDKNCSKSWNETVGKIIGMEIKY
jgi:TRAP-type C4-dicarboxylate transport system substrate-binding protein